MASSQYFRAKLSSNLDGINADRLHGRAESVEQLTDRPQSYMAPTVMPDRVKSRSLQELGK